MDNLFLIRFLIGGALVAGTTWVAESIDPKFGGILASIPSTTILTLLIINSILGEKGAVLYAKGLVIGNIPWYGYILAVILLAQRIGVAKSVAIGIIIWLVLVPITWKLSRPI